MEYIEKRKFIPVSVGNGRKGIDFLLEGKCGYNSRNNFQNWSIRRN